MDVVARLPLEICLLILFQLSPRDLVLCRLVCRAWNGIMQSRWVSRKLMWHFFPRCREIRLWTAGNALNQGLLDTRSVSHNHFVEIRAAAERVQDTAWETVFGLVARRYHHLRLSRPFAMERIDIATPREWLFIERTVCYWDRQLQTYAGHQEFHTPELVWWYSREDGLLVYPAEPAAWPWVCCAPNPYETGFVYQLFDPEMKKHTVVPFDVRNKIIRRVRLAQGVLIFEWAVSEPSWIEDSVHDHYATAFDVVRTPMVARAAHRGPRWAWLVSFRSVWILNWLGFSLTQSDRFLSAHNATHYALYFYREPYLRGAAVAEEAAVWDIRFPGGRGPYDRVVTPPSIAHAGISPRGGPRVVRKLDRDELDMYGVLQDDSPRLRNLALDEHNLYFIEEEHRWAHGGHVGQNHRPRFHSVKSTGIPVVPLDAGRPPPNRSIQCVVFGPHQVDECGDVDSTSSTTYTTSCCRHTDSPSQATGSLDCLRRRLSASHATTDGIPSLPVPATDDESDGEEVESAREAGHELPDEDDDNGTPWPWNQGDGHMPSGRHPSLAPCWRHDRFPHVTVAEMIDLDAGVRISAHRCFMLRYLSVHLRPGPSAWANSLPAGLPTSLPTSLPTERREPVDNEHGNGGETERQVLRRQQLQNISRDIHQALSFSTAGRVAEMVIPQQASSSHEQQPLHPDLDSLYDDIVGYGSIAGDERWLIGQNSQGRLTVLWF